MMVARSEGAVETENRDLRGIEGTEVVRSWDRRRGIQHDSRFSFGPSGYWWTGNVTGRTGTGMVIDSDGGCAEHEAPVALPDGCSEGCQM